MCKGTQRNKVDCLRLTDLLNWAIYSWEDVGIFITLCFNPMHFGKLLGHFHEGPETVQESSSRAKLLMLQVTTMELKCATTTCCQTRVGNAILGILPS